MKHFWLDAGSAAGYGSGFTALSPIDPSNAEDRVTPDTQEGSDGERPDPDRLDEPAE